MWTQISFDLSPYKGKTALFRFRYATDGGLHYNGPFLDDLALTVDGGSPMVDNVESAGGVWTAAGFTRMGGSTSVDLANFYLPENRVYAGYDATLKTGPYNFGRPGLSGTPGLRAALAGRAEARVARAVRMRAVGRFLTRPKHY